jgi:hypothetical protein
MNRAAFPPDHFMTTAEEVQMSFVNKGLGTIARAVGGALALSILVAGQAARAEDFTDYEVATSLVCDTPQQVERFITLFKGDDTAQAVKAVNAEARDPSACTVASLAFVRGKEAGTIHQRDQAYTIVHILVLGVVTDDGIRAIPPSAHFTLFAVREFAV